MGNNSGAACCSAARDEVHTSLHTEEATPTSDRPINGTPGEESAGPSGGSSAGARGMAKGSASSSASASTYRVYLEKPKGGRLGIDVDFVRERSILPISAVTGGVAEAWNLAHPESPLRQGDSIVDVNGTRGDVAQMMQKCKHEAFLELTLRRSFNYEELVKELEELVHSQRCGPILLRLSWHDAGVFSTGQHPGGCPNAAMRFPGAGEAAFLANAGLPTVALGLLAPISDKFCPDLISHADLWALAANVAIRIMGGPAIPTRFGRVDAISSMESVASPEGRLPDGAGDAAHLRQIFHPKGFSDKQIVALSGAHTVGRCHLDRSGFDGAWTEDPLRFDGSYFKDLLERSFKVEKTSAGCEQHRSEVGTIMLPSDLALLHTPGFRAFVEHYGADEEAFFVDFAECWTRLQELGTTRLRDVL